MPDIIALIVVVIAMFLAELLLAKGKGRTRHLRSGNKDIYYIDDGQNNQTIVIPKVNRAGSRLDLFRANEIVKQFNKNLEQGKKDD